MSRIAWLLLLSLWIPGLVFAESIDLRQRLLLAIEKDDLWVVRRVELSEHIFGVPADGQRTRVERRALERRAALGSDAHGALLLWFDNDGVLIERRSLSDPRIRRAPMDITRSQRDEKHAHAARDSIALVVEGPRQAASLRISVPESPAYGMTAKSWQLALN